MLCRFAQRLRVVRPSMRKRKLHGAASPSGTPLNSEWNGAETDSIAQRLPPIPEGVRAQFADGRWEAARRALFTQTVQMPALRVPKQACHLLVKSKPQWLLRWPRIPAVQPALDATDEEHKLVLLHTAPDAAELTEEQVPVTCPVTITYDQYTAADLLKAILPEDTEITTAFETIGHIAHLNLREEHAHYKHVIGHIIYDKNHPRIRTVVNKLDSIDTTFRFFKMEVIAGDEDFITSVSEAGCLFHLDYSKVYWNTRLSTEHGRLVKTYFKKGESIADVMAGVGPFAIPAAKQYVDVQALKQAQKKAKYELKGSTKHQEAKTGKATADPLPFVFANDLNPESYKWLTINAEKNKVKDYVWTYNLDGKAFIQQSLRDARALPGKEANVIVPLHHYVMNLPASAIEFIDGYVGLYKDQDRIAQSAAPFLHLYTFSASSDAKADILTRMAEQWSMPKQDLEASEKELEMAFHMVRKVSPKKEMWCVSTRLPLRVLYDDRST